MTRKRKVDALGEPVFIFPADPEALTDEQVEELTKLLNMSALREWVAEAVKASVLAEQKRLDQSAQSGPP